MDRKSNVVSSRDLYALCDKILEHGHGYILLSAKSAFIISEYASIGEFSGRNPRLVGRSASATCVAGGTIR
jgi:hypothetical protein